MEQEHALKQPDRDRAVAEDQPALRRAALDDFGVVRAAVVLP